ncbi:uncharacterized protein EV420DRAFT_1564913 [Desarmillaria tabescens]|uniref:Vacuolar calcium ion transporter n=1 Tax=Armillaria tabescens TaxID=1929756 RepID=A0AA39MWG5_ARMTA|nr:uncharacterized protein EV420DRAFT_1564913 [Desarmillaria tabescens]KAK0449596.1 hypothetical protein EV420DRAFT_1564913 [Desarmillaria tabescens]
MFRIFRHPSPPRLEQPSLLSDPSEYRGPGFFLRCWTVLKAEGESSWLDSYKSFLFGSYLNLLLLFVPLSAVAHHRDWDASFRFSFSLIAIVPLSKLLGQSTEQISFKLGQTSAGLLNVLFGNPEFIVGVTALLRDELDLVQSTMLGSILYNFLLMLGCSFLAAGIRYSESSFEVTASQNSGSLMTLASITFVIPAMYHSIKLDGADLHVIDDPAALRGLLIISRGTAIMLLLVYIAYLFFELTSHNYLFFSDADDEELDIEPPGMSAVSAGTAFLVVAITTFFCVDHLVTSIEEFTDEYHVPKSIIGLVIIPITMNIVDHIITVWTAQGTAMGGNMGAALGICIGNAISIGTFVMPFLVLLGWVSHHELTLFFGKFEACVIFAGIAFRFLFAAQTICLYVSVLFVNAIVQDGKSNYLEGFMLITLYVVIVLAFSVFYYV